VTIPLDNSELVGTHIGHLLWSRRVNVRRFCVTGDRDALALRGPQGPTESRFFSNGIVRELRLPRTTPRVANRLASWKANRMSSEFKRVRSRMLRPRQTALLLSIGIAAAACSGGAEDPLEGLVPTAPLSSGATPSGTAPVTGPIPGSTGAAPTTSAPPVTVPTDSAGMPINSSAPVASTGPSPQQMAIEAAVPVTQLRLLTQIEYKNSVAALLGVTIPDTLVLPDDNSVAGFGSVGASVVAVSESAAEKYETASQTLVQGIFTDAARWQALVGCQPQVALQEACVEDFVRSFGRRAFRRDLTEAEVTQWLGVARAAATAADDAATGLAAVTAGLLQSPNFLYRAEHAVPDVALLRLKFDGPSMATRLAYAITGASPDEALLADAAAGKLDTLEGIRTAATSLLSKPEANQFMLEFFTELTQLPHAEFVERDPEVFPTLTDSLRASMIEEARRWLADVVLAPTADVRTLFNSSTTYVDAPLASFYGLQAPPGNGFQKVELPPESGRAGILGKAGFLMAHSSPDSTNPTRRGNFILKSFTCTVVPLPEITVSLPKAVEGEGPKTTRQLFEGHLIDDSCVGCHTLMDPFGFALEHFDAIGKYRETENGLPIDAEASFGASTFDGALELGQVLHDDARTPSCFVRNFYRYANGSVDDTTDSAVITALAGTLQQKGYVWRDLVLEFVTSDAFTSFPPAIATIAPTLEQ
jgi:Protein of unknown function (DUF1592)/Protein of unknown function (DUF1588)/Protein of unknown function (DUF1595)/Protein of unknown function (DUF1587)/Protein of unknown function (DUF1585)